MPELNAITAIAGRDLLKFIRDPGRLVAAVVFPFVMIFLLGGTLQLNLGQSAGFNFIGFAFTGFLGMTLFQSTAQGLTSLMEDRHDQHGRGGNPKAKRRRFGLESCDQADQSHRDHIEAEQHQQDR